MKRTTGVAVLMVAATFMLAACSQSDDAETTAQDVEKEAREFISTLGQFSANQRDDALEKAQRALDNLDSQISELEERIDRDWDTMSSEARQKTRDNLSRLREHRGELSGWYDDFRNSSAGAWESMKEGFSDAYGELSDSWIDAKRDFEAQQEQ